LCIIPCHDFWYNTKLDRALLIVGVVLLIHPHLVRRLLCKVMNFAMPLIRLKNWICMKSFIYLHKGASIKYNAYYLHSTFLFITWKTIEYRKLKSCFKKVHRFTYSFPYTTSISFTNVKEKDEEKNWMEVEENGSSNICALSPSLFFLVGLANSIKCCMLWCSLQPNKSIFYLVSSKNWFASIFHRQNRNPFFSFPFLGQRKKRNSIVMMMMMMMIIIIIILFFKGYSLRFEF